MRPPICEVCDEVFDPDDGGLVDCLPEQNETTLDDAPDAPGLVRHPPEQGWFCARHVIAAREAATSRTLSEVVAEVRSGAASIAEGRLPSPPTDEKDLDPPQEPAADPLDPAPDLVGVDLGSGSIRRGRLRPDTSWVAWDTRRRVGAVVRIFRENLPDYLAAIGATTVVPELEATTKRSWTPMDGAVEPNCPFSDERRWVGVDGDLEIEIASTEAFWSEGDVSNTSASLSISIGGERALRLSHSQRLDSGDKVASLWLWRPTTASAVALTRRLFDV